tara:strand:+ start:346 stop:483 length:138 start_codon:yes stop_codon:yes gene_type:complete
MGKIEDMKYTTGESLPLLRPWILETVGSLSIKITGTEEPACGRFV